MSSHVPHRQPRLPVGPVDRPADFQRRLDEAFERLRGVLAGRQKQALHGVSPQYLSAVLHRQTGVSLERFVELVTTACNRAEQAFVLGALVEDERRSAKPAAIEIAEAIEATGEALGLAQRIVAASSVSPRDQESARTALRRAVMEIHDVEDAVAGGAL